LEDVIAYVSCGRSWFYEAFKDGSDEMDNIKSLLAENKITTKVKMRKKWEDSENATLQMGLMKLIGTDEEAHRLNGTRQNIDHTTKGESINDVSGLSTDELIKRAKAVKKISE
jgi:hypothetical protein